MAVTDLINTFARFGRIDAKNFLQLLNNEFIKIPNLPTRFADHSTLYSKYRKVDLCFILHIQSEPFQVDRHAVYGSNSHAAAAAIAFLEARKTSLSPTAGFLITCNPEIVDYKSILAKLAPQLFIACIPSSKCKVGDEAIIGGYGVLACEVHWKERDGIEVNKILESLSGIENSYPFLEMDAQSVNLKSRGPSSIVFEVVFNLRSTAKYLVHFYTNRIHQVAPTLHVSWKVVARPWYNNDQKSKSWFRRVIEAQSNTRLKYSITNQSSNTFQVNQLSNTIGIGPLNKESTLIQEIETMSRLYRAIIDNYAKRV